MRQNYASVKIPKSLAKEIDTFRDAHPHFRSRAEVVVTAIRQYLPLEVEVAVT